MNNYITIDGGTTNTRVYLVRNGAIVIVENISIGSKDCTKGNHVFKQGLKNVINSILAKYALKESDIECIIASGMITSEYGLSSLPHLVAPVGKKELHQGMTKQIFSEITPIPFFFIPGVKNQGNKFDIVDMMRGEETELMGLIKAYGCDYLYVFPGSHTKLVIVDEKEQIACCNTMMTGEMIEALSQNTILKETICLDEMQYDEKFLLLGYRECLQKGFNQALFKTRILNTLFRYRKSECYSYFLGVIFTNEIEAIKKSGKKGVIVAGKEQLKNPLAALLKEVTELKVICVSRAEGMEATCRGAIQIYEEGHD